MKRLGVAVCGPFAITGLVWHAMAHAAVRFTNQVSNDMEVLIRAFDTVLFSAIIMGATYLAVRHIKEWSES